MTEKKNIYSMTSEMPKPVHTIRLKDPLFEDLGVPPGSVAIVTYESLQSPDYKLPEKGERFRVELGDVPFSAEIGKRIREMFEKRTGDRGLLIITTHAAFDPAAIAAMRNALWPAYHSYHAYKIAEQDYVDRLSAEGFEKLLKHFVATWNGSAVAARPRAAALAPDATISKFNKNAAGWSGDPKSPLYAHHRWMRKLVAELGEPKPGERTLDAGCGAGWVGIEAAKLGANVFAFDPSPEMVKFAIENAAAESVKIEAQTGFVEKSPWTDPFSLVLNSGVISFAPNAELYLNALDAMVAKGGRLVIGDVNPLSRGMQARRARVAVLPIREMNGIGRADIIKMLEARGYKITARRYYQLTAPWDKWMHLLAKRAGGFGCGWILNKNKAAAIRDSEDAAGFDSWLVRAEKS
ncbi:MAG: class I SAM-dependent methyltransferase [Planctomycetes bacterium]|nr:class I SAM-dependent methyltransferase [Planctomycetota bacterium]